MENRPAGQCADEGGVAVVIAAFNARATIGRAIASALAEPEVREVVVVDDRSSDDTVACARAADDGSDRLLIVTSDVNAGPAAARNRGFDLCKSPFIALLDSDDFFLPGRFKALLAHSDWDFIADNVAIVREDKLSTTPLQALSTPLGDSFCLTAATFVESCITRPRRYRGELAFLKPVMKRAFLARHGLRYAPQLRLAEDYGFYTRSLMAGARFLVIGSSHYVAVERATSLSATHSVEDLARFAGVDRALIEQSDDAALRTVLRRHLAQTNRRFRHRAFLAQKAEHGLLSALSAGASRPVELSTVLGKVLLDKLGGFFPRSPREEPRALRYLIEP